MKRVAGVLLAVNVAYLFGVHSAAARAVSMAGCLSALALLLARLPVSTVPAAGSIVPAAAFALPILGSLHPVMIGFWRADPRGLLIVAWLVTFAWLVRAAHEPKQRAGESRLPLLTILFVVWTSLFWLSVVWDVGIGRAVLTTTHDDRVIFSFRLWQTHPPSEHLFLMWLTPEDFAVHRAYTNHLHPYLFSLYGVVRLAQLATGCSPYVARNLTPFAVAAVGVVAFVFVLLRSGWASTPPSAKSYSSLFLALGLFVSEWHFWISMYTTNFDDVFPLIVFLLAVLAACTAPRPARADDRLVIASAILFGAFGWLYTPVAILALWCYYGRLRSGGNFIRANRSLINVSLASGITGAVALLVPRALVAMKGYDTVSSPFLFRSGLDGDTRYFHDVAQAVLRPFYGNPRTWWSMLFPAFVPVAVWLTWGTAGGAAARRRLVRAILLLTSPYWFSIALFPQSVSIHPYLYDQLLFLPAALIGALWSVSPTVQRRIRGPSVLALLLLYVALLMANLTAIAQGVRAALPG
jgi:hypothetical protein